MRADLAVIGSGITALSVLYHLNQLGIKSIICISPEELAPSWAKVTGYASSGQWDNFTRYQHGHGSQAAEALWHLGNAGFLGLHKFAQEHEVPFVLGKRLRYLTSERELEEAAKAVELLQAAGLGGELHSSLGENVLGVQEERAPAMWVDVQALRAKMLARCQNKKVQFVEGTVQRLEDAGNGIVLHLRNGIRVHSEMVVLAAGLGCVEFFPQLSEIVVPVADQQACYALKGQVGGDFVTAMHGHYWFSFQPGRVVMGGARFLRHLAGIGDPAPQVLEKVLQQQKMMFGKFFPKLHLGGFLGAGAWSDIIPCDELPMVGPLGENHRVFLACGYGFLGLSNGFAAGAELAKMIAGVRSELVLSFGLERLRSL